MLRFAVTTVQKWMKMGCILWSNRVKDDKVSLDLVLDKSIGSLRYLSVTKIEKAMGFLTDYTK
jgi:hypothetical protein